MLARTHSRHEFATADAINELGALAVVPRKVAVIEATKTEPRRREDVPFVSKYIFLAVTPEQWHRVHTGRLYAPSGKLLPAPIRVLEINPSEWRGTKNGNGGCQGFFTRAEEAYQRRAEQFDTGGTVARYKRGDKLRIIGPDLLTGQMSVQIAEFIRMDQHGRADVHFNGLAMFGRPISTNISLDQIEGIAAE